MAAMRRRELRESMKNSPNERSPARVNNLLFDNENNDSNNNSRNQDQLYYDEYMNDLDGY